MIVHNKMEYKENLVSSTICYTLFLEPEGKRGQQVLAREGKNIQCQYLTEKRRIAKKIIESKRSWDI